MGGNVVKYLILFLSFSAHADPLEDIANEISHTADNIAVGLTMVAAGSSHQFDWVNDWQGSITAASLLDHDADAVSFGMGKKAAGVLWHGSYTMSRYDELVVVGGSFRW